MFGSVWVVEELAKKSAPSVARGVEWLGEELPVVPVPQLGQSKLRKQVAVLESETQ